MNKWMSHSLRDEGMSLICVPFAGGGAGTYASWQRFADSEVSVSALCMPGREGRAREPLIDDYGTLCQILADELLPELLGRRIVLYGHSLGAWIAWDLALMLEQRGHPPLGLMIGAQRAPSRPYPFANSSQLDDESLLGLLSRGGGIGLTQLGRGAVRDWILAVLRSDLALCETRELSNARGSFPIAAFSGRADQIVSQEDVQAWARHTTSTFFHDAIDGGHLFVRSHAESLCRHIERVMRGWGVLEQELIGVMT